MTDATPGRRLHAALLAHGIVQDGWDTLHPSQHRDLDQAESWLLAEEQAERRKRRKGRDGRGGRYAPLRSVEQGRRVAAHPAASIADGGLHDRLDALTAEVAALRRAQDDDLHAMGEVGARLTAIEERLARLERWRAGTVRRALDGGDPCPLCEGRGWSVNVPSGSMYPCSRCDGRGRLAVDGGDPDAPPDRCEGRDGEIIERLGKLEADSLGTDLWQDDADELLGKLADRLAALEARQIDGGDPLRRTG